MSDDFEPEPPPLPPSIWMLLAVLVILAVIGLLYLLHPPGVMGAPALARRRP